MSKWLRVAARLFAALFFLLGAMFLPFYVWVSPGQGSNPILGWVIFLFYLLSILIPWAIAYWLVRYSLRRNEDENDKTL